MGSDFDSRLRHERFSAAELREFRNTSQLLSLAALGLLAVLGSRITAYS